MDTKKKPEGKNTFTDKPDEPQAAIEHGGRGGLDPTRFGDWEKNGRCVDF